MIYMLRKEACSRSTHDLAHIPTQNCLADCLTKSSAKADNLITAAKTGRLFNVDFHLNFRTLMEHKAFLSTWCRTFMHTREKIVSFLGAIEISLLPESREGPFHVMFVRTPMGFRESRCCEHTVCTRRLTQLFIHEDDDIVHVSGCKNSFFLVFSLSFSHCVVTMPTSRPTGI